MINTPVTENLRICLKCENRHPVHMGQTRCKTDEATIQEHANAGSCPLGLLMPVKLAPSDLRCIYRGEEVRQQACQTCKISTSVKVFACSLHRECHQFDKPLIGVRACRGCRDIVHELPGGAS